MKVLITHSYFLNLDTKQVAHGQPYPPLATLLAAALLRENGYTVHFADIMFAHSPEKILKELERFQPDVFIIYDDSFNYLTKMCLSNMREAAFHMQLLAQKLGCTVIVSGSDATDHYHQYLHHGADFVILGEAEHTLLELMNALKNEDNDWGKIAGIAWKEEHVMRSAPRAVIKNLDTLPLPAWDMVDIKPYKKVWLKKHGYFSINIATTRGCPYKCNWCAKPVYGNSYHMRSVDSVVKEIEWLKDLFQIDHIWFCDDIFGLKRSWVVEFANLIKEKNIHIQYKIQSRADLLIQEKYVAALAASGCNDVWMGAESGSQKILDAMDKGTTIEQIITARQLLREHGIKASYFIQYGYPGETVSDIHKTLNLIHDTLPDDIGISVSYPLPGTKFYDTVKEQLKNKTNWKDSDDLDMMFLNLYPRHFYKQLHRYTHYYYRLTKLQQQKQRDWRDQLRSLKYLILTHYYKKRLRKVTHEI